MPRELNDPHTVAHGHVFALANDFKSGFGQCPFGLLLPDAGEPRHQTVTSSR